MAKYLIYNTEEEAKQRAFQEGERKNLYFFRGLPDSHKGSKYITYPKVTSNNDFALDVSEYELTTEEQSMSTSSVTFPTPDFG